MGGAAEQLAVVEQVVEQVRLGAVALFHGDKTAGFFDPAEDLAAYVDTKGVGRVVHGALVCLDAIIHVRGAVGVGRALPNEVVADNDHGYAAAPAFFCAPA